MYCKLPKMFVWHLYICTFVHLYICTFVHLYICTSVHLHICTSYICSFQQTVFCIFNNCNPSSDGRAPAVHTVWLLLSTSLVRVTIAWGLIYADAAQIGIRNARLSVARPADPDLPNGQRGEADKMLASGRILPASPRWPFGISGSAARAPSSVLK